MEKSCMYLEIYLKNMHRCKVMVKSHFLPFLIVCSFSESMISNTQVSTVHVISEVTSLSRYSSHSQVSQLSSNA